MTLPNQIKTILQVTALIVALLAGFGCGNQPKKATNTNYEKNALVLAYEAIVRFYCDSGEYVAHDEYEFIFVSFPNSFSIEPLLKLMIDYRVPVKSAEGGIVNPTGVWNSDKTQRGILVDILSVEQLSNERVTLLARLFVNGHYGIAHKFDIQVEQGHGAQVVEAKIVARM